MSQDPRGRAPGGSDTGLAERAEALLDEAVGLAAKGGYGEAADKAQQALAIDPDNVVARDLLASYRHQVADDDERRRRRRSIAAAAAAIEEMVEDDRIEEAATATDVLALQFGADAPVDELRRRIVESRAAHLDFHDLDAAIDAIRVPGPQSSPSPSARLDPAGALASEIEEHLRAGRFEQANRLVGRLESEPGAKERAQKLRTRIEEAAHVAADHRREEEILIATAAIEERLRRGSIDDAATRLDELAASHGASAPVAELRERLDEARAREDARAIAASGAADGDTATADGAPVDSTPTAAAPVFGQSMVEAESRGPGRLIAIAAVVALLIAGGWWMLSRPSDRGVAPSGAEPSSAAASDAAATGDSAGALPNGQTSTGVSPAANAIDSSDTRGAAPSLAHGADPARSTSGGEAATTNGQQGRASSAAGVQTGQTAAPAAPASAPAAAAPAAPTEDRASETQRARANVVPPSAEVAPPGGGSSDATAPPASAAAPPVSAPAAAPQDGTTQVVIEPVPAGQAPAAAPPPPPVETAPAPASAGDTAAATDRSAADRSAAATEPPPSAPPPAPANAGSERAAAEPPARAAAAPPPAPASTSAGPVVLGCGEPGVVCLKSVAVPTPHYPAQARARKLTADVVVMALVDEQGHVIQTRVDHGSFVFFNDAAIEAAKRATFQPASKNGVPGRSWAKLTFHFDQQ